MQKQTYNGPPQNIEGGSHPNLMQPANMQVTVGMEGANNPVSGLPSAAGYMQSQQKSDQMPASSDTRKKTVCTAPRIHVCSLCDKAYTRRDLLNRHKVVHTGVKDHVCTVCNKEFYRKDKLKRHEQIHLKDLNMFCRVSVNDVNFAY